MNINFQLTGEKIFVSRLPILIAARKFLNYRARASLEREREREREREGGALYLHSRM